MEKYITLGEKATTFFDPDTKINLVGKEVKKVLAAQLKSPRVKRFLKGGGLVLVGKEEYKEYLASIEKSKVTLKNEEEDTKAEKTLQEMSIKELKAHIEKSGWEQKDIDDGLQLVKKADLIEFIEQTSASYED
jgi:hypothetical protein